MRKLLLPLLLVVSAAGLFVAISIRQISGAPPYGETLEEVPDISDPYDWIRNWQRPEGSARVALQAGHFKSAEVPEELERLRSNTGSSGGGKWEWEVNLEIANLTAEILRSKGIETEILPATIPPRYWADVFVAIHADGNLNRRVSGFKVAAPWRDWSGNAGQLAQIMDENYYQATGMARDPNISRNMRGYYAFSWWRYDHALHPKTTSVIIETGFLTNFGDRKIIVDNPQVAARGIANGVMEYLAEANLWSDPGEF